MKLIGVDYGRRRIGVAVGESGVGIAHGLCVIDRKKLHDSIGELIRIIGDELPKAIVFGVPLGKDEEETVMSKEARKFASMLSERMEAVSTSERLPIYFIDESFTSKKAVSVMMSRKKRARRDKSLSDRVAACLILQDFIDNESASLLKTVPNG